MIGTVKKIFTRAVAVWGEYTASPPTLTDGDTAPLQVDVNGQLKVAVTGSGPAAAAPADGVAASTAMGKVNAWLSAYNGATEDRMRSGLSGALASALGFLNVLAGGQYNLTKPTLGDTNFSTHQFDANANLRTAEQFAPGYENNGAGIAYTLPKAVPTNDGAWSFTSSGGTAIGTGGVSIKASAGRVRRISVTNKNATTGFYFMLCNLTTAPGATAVPVERWWVGERDATAKDVNNTVVVDFGPDGLYLGTGIGIAASSTVDTVTLLAGLDCHYNIVWI